MIYSTSIQSNLTGSRKSEGKNFVRPNWESSRACLLTQTGSARVQVFIDLFQAIHERERGICFPAAGVRAGDDFVAFVQRDPNTHIQIPFLKFL